MSRARVSSRQATALLCVLSTLMLAFAPLLPMASARSSDVDLSAYALPDGTLPFICGLGRFDPDRPHVEPLCPLCTLANTLGLPPTDLAGGVLRLAYRAAPMEPATLAGYGRFRSAHRARAPPVRV